MSLLMSVKVPKHLTAKYLKKHYSLIPLFGFVGLGMVGATAYGIRLAVSNPDIAFRKKGNPEPFRNRLDENGNSIGFKLFSVKSNNPNFGVNTIPYGSPAFPEERPPIERWWKWEEN